MENRTLILLLSFCLFADASLSLTLSSKLVHRFSEEAMAVWESRSGGNASLKPWPKRNSFNYFQLLLKSDLKRHRLKLGSKRDLLIPSQGSQTLFFGNELDWWVYFSSLFGYSGNEGKFSYFFLKISWVFMVLVLIIWIYYFLDFQVALCLDWHRDTECFVYGCIGWWERFALGPMWLHTMCPSVCLQLWFFGIPFPSQITNYLGRILYLLIYFCPVKLFFKSTCHL